MRHTFLLPSLKKKKNCFQFYIKFEFKTAFSKKKYYLKEKNTFGLSLLVSLLKEKNTGFIESRLLFIVSLLKEKILVLLNLDYHFWFHFCFGLSC